MNYKYSKGTVLYSGNILEYKNHTIILEISLQEKSDFLDFHTIQYREVTNHFEVYDTTTGDRLYNSKVFNTLQEIIDYIDI